MHDRDCGICLLVFWGNPPLPRVHAYASFPHRRRDARGVPRPLHYNDRWATPSPTIPARNMPWAPIGRRALDEDSQNRLIWRLLRNLTGFRRPRSLAAGPPYPPLPPWSRHAAKSPSRRQCTSPNTSTWVPIRLFHPKLLHPAPIHCLGRRPSPPSGTMGRLPECLLQRRPPRGKARPNGAIRFCPCRVTAPPHPLCCYRAISYLHPPPRCRNCASVEAGFVAWSRGSP